jgi:hypothetical protein
MNPYRYRVALQATHPSADLAPLFEALRLVPTRLWTAGTPRQGADGAPLGGTHRDSYATAPLTPGDASRAWAEEPFECFMHRTLDALSHHRPALEALSTDGGRCGLSIDLHGEDPFVFELDAPIHTRMAALKLSLTFDIRP